jgi:hypothetical protein
MAIPEAKDPKPPVHPAAAPGIGHVYRTSGGVDSNGDPVDDAYRKITKTIMAHDIDPAKMRANANAKKMVNGEVVQAAPAAQTGGGAHNAPIGGASPAPAPDDEPDAASAEEATITASAKKAPTKTRKGSKRKK